jgi:hypothetical protein
MASNPVNRKAVALLVLVFALGAGLGVVGTLLLNQRVFGARVQQQQRGVPGAGPVHLTGRLTQELSLSADQEKKVSDILTDMQGGYDGVRRQMNPQFDQIRNHGRDEIRQLLTPEQRPKFEDFLRRVDEDRRKRQNR